MSFPYKEVFAAAESSLKAMMPPEKVAARLDPFLKYEFSGRRLTDEECYRLLVHIVFYSGFRAATVTRKLGVIDRHFGDWQMVAAYGVTEVEAILAKLRRVSRTPRSLANWSGNMDRSEPTSIPFAQTSPWRTCFC